MDVSVTPMQSVGLLSGSADKFKPNKFLIRAKACLALRLVVFMALTFPFLAL